MMSPHIPEPKVDTQLKEDSLRILKPIFPDYTEEQLILAGERIVDFLEYAYVLCKDDMNRKRAEEGRPLL